jgi:hypothetical protein
VAEGTDEHWQRFLETMQAMAEELGGFGEATLSVTFHEGYPITMERQSGVRRYRFGPGAARLTTRPRLVRVKPTTA